MTIYAAKSAEKSKEESEASLEAAGGGESETNQTSVEKVNAHTVYKPSYSGGHRPRRAGPSGVCGKKFVALCIASAISVILICGIILGVVIYKTGLEKLFRGWCDVHFYEYRREGQSRRVHDGSFRQEVIIDLDYGTFERFEVPRIGESRKATIIHDFEKNLTAIADEERSRCFVLTLGRNMVRTPKDFYEMLNRMKAGFHIDYMPDAEIVRETYHVVTPPVQRLAPYGYNIWKECHMCNTYLLTRGDSLAIGLSKRSACELAGDQYCLGAGGTDRMLCVNIKDCL